MFWDGTRWVVEANRVARRRGDAGLQPLATLVVGVITAAAVLLQVVPFSSTRAGGPTLTVSPGSAAVGTKISLSGSAFPARASVQLEWDGSPAGMPRISVRGNGTFSTSLKVPQAAVGTHTLAAVALVTQKGAKAATIGSMLATASLTVATLATPTPTLSATATPSSTPRPTTQPTQAPTSTPAPTTATAPPTPVPTTQPTSTPAVTGAPNATPVPPIGGTSDFVTRCGLYFCAGGSRWSLYAASDLGGLDDPDTRASMAVAGGLNTLRIVNFLDEGDAPSTAAYDGWHWQRLDKVIASARARGLRVLLDFSTYRNLLWNAGLNPYTVDWQPFLQFAANRTNTVTGVRYRDDPTIALVAFAGEVEPVNASSDTRGVTTSQITSFFSRTFAEWKALDPNHLVSPGGFLQIDWNSGIDWKSIFALADNDVCSIHDYSDADRTITTPAVSTYCASIGRPWITEEFGWEQSIGDATRAALFQTMFDAQMTYHAAGVGFWNLGTQLGGTTYDVNSGTARTWSTVIANAP